MNSNKIKYNIGNIGLRMFVYFAYDTVKQHHLNEQVFLYVLANL